ncbi:MAG TPA: hypothetical protein VGL68_09715 [Solirubrobacteraceae bacterium]|jgi:hypothetical protein
MSVATAVPARAQASTRAQALTTPAPAPAPTPAPAQTSATISPSISPNRLGAKASLTLTIHYTTAAVGLFYIPPPVLRTAVRLPAGLNLDIPDLRSCSASRLRARGPRACPAQAQIGRGSALIKTHVGTVNLPEAIALNAFLGPLQGGQQVLDILGQGYSPFDERLVFTGAVRFVPAPYGEELVLSIPPIPTLRFEPDASIVTFTLTIGAHGRAARHANTLLVPSTCPPGGFPFAAEFTYADGSTGSALATAACPA